MKNRILAVETSKKVGENITVAGWVHSRRDHGGLIFIDLRDHTGLVQLVINPDKKDAFSLAESLRDEFVVRACGVVAERGEGLKNPNIASGDVEIVVDNLEILNRAETLPIQPFAEDNQAGEELRFKYRYLDLRRPKMQNMLKKRAEMYRRIHEYMDGRDFIEIQTPILANSSPEGARDFLIPSRLQEGKFYALPQAPQQFKQLLMVGGVPRYYQLAACFRDEDPRADRLYGEFYQLDLEMSFAENGEEVRTEVEPLMKQLATDFAGKKLLDLSDLAVGDGNSIPRISYRDAMETYGSDKPDLRFGMELIELTDVFSETEFGVFKNAECIKAICVKNGASLSRKQIDNFTNIAKSEGAGGLAYITYQDGEAKSPIAKFLSEKELADIQQKTGAVDGDAVFFGADSRSVVNAVLGRLRNEFASHFNLKDPSVVAFAWIVDFPFYEWDDRSKKLDFGHNPFSMPKGGLQALESAETDAEKLSIVADQFDMVMNGYEICSGGVRNHNPAVLYKVFGLLGFSEAYVEEKFGAMLGAFKYGAPPHAGCAFGVDRILMELTDEQNVRETLAFPKNGSGVDVMMNSPSVVDPAQLRELGL
ncbi:MULTISPECIES: aspartate--tRNA ligase [unclassified Candidatus Nanosynbacter]|uniref:aspartate--tRNA ligase n=1 Tax=unclassified Candidatus Nanosynbacter TaxID=2725944 RepID=UPI001FB7235D|nr:MULTISPECIES: aspartate--tRNA ligase [unclassified Candidatus Nanosynbacter]MCJ1963583.1 aspartate--tRNA ligase [Candidatus Nanosynbacter sp. TM7-033]UOG68068.1 aspartate--tRNA ligase [Candidatus Nanosynbacter sp. HMT-352]